MVKKEIAQAAVDARHKELNTEAIAGGYYLNPDVEFTKDLVQGLLVNEARYGYPSCPCRLASGEKADDLDIICPCDYRDADVVEFDTCYCGLYVSNAVVKAQKQIGKIPERRPPIEKRTKKKATVGRAALSYPIWRCRVCGYLCARDNPPEVCPICKAKKERFEKFIDGI
jgi:ferredoxin-thioredoxin reductase catalytic chain